MANNIKNNWINFRVYKYLTKAGLLDTEGRSFAEYMRDLDGQSLIESAELSGASASDANAEAEKASDVFDAQLEKGRALIAPNLEYPMSQAIEAVKSNSPFEVSDSNSG